MKTKRQAPGVNVLLAERQRLQAQIQALDHVIAILQASSNAYVPRPNGLPPAAAPAKGRPKGHVMSDEAKQKISLRMKALWAKRSKAEKRAQAQLMRSGRQP